MEFKKKNVGQLRYPNQYYGSPPTILYTYGVGNPLILKTEIHPCRRHFTAEFKIGKYKCFYELVVKQIIEKVSLKLACKDICKIFGIPNFHIM